MPVQFDLSVNNIICQCLLSRSKMVGHPHDHTVCAHEPFTPCYYVMVILRDILPWLESDRMVGDALCKPL